MTTWEEWAIKELRQKRILSILKTQGAVEIAQLAQIMPQVSPVTLRRDITELAENRLLKRTHGGAVLPDIEALERAVRRASDEEASREAQLSDFDAIILGPLTGRGAEAMRRQIRRLGLPFLAESAPQEGGRYLGPDNFAAGHDLGVLAGQQAEGAEAAILHICVSELENARERSDGFDAGFREAFGGQMRAIRVNGQGVFRAAKRVAVEALRANPDISVAFAVNDHSAIAMLEAAEREARDIAVYAAGGEDPDFIARVQDGGPLRAVAALFPQVVGIAAVEHALDMIADASAETASIITPHRVITPRSFPTLFEVSSDAGAGRARVRAAQLAELAPAQRTDRTAQGARIAFVPHYPAHDWYREMGAAMRERAAAYGVTVDIAPPHEGIRRELDRLRLRIAYAAADQVGAGETVILSHGETTQHLAAALTRRAAERPESIEGTTVVTNSLDVMRALNGIAGLKVILTAGEFQEADRCLVGPSVGALFERLRADKLFLSVDGISAEFGASAIDERLALAGARCSAAARRVIALADHVAVGVDANHRIAGLDAIDELITDDGVLPEERNRLSAAGIVVTIADEDDIDPRAAAGSARTRNLSGRTVS